MNDSNSTANVEERRATEDANSRTVIESKIRYVLTHFPAINGTMLQMGIGPGVPPAIWRPVLEAMIEDGIVVREDRLVTGPSGRNASIQRLRLATTNKDLLEQAVKGLAA